MSDRRDDIRTILKYVAPHNRDQAFKMSLGRRRYVNLVDRNTLAPVRRYIRGKASFSKLLQELPQRYTVPLSVDVDGSVRRYIPAFNDHSVLPIVRHHYNILDWRDREYSYIADRLRYRAGLTWQKPRRRRLRPWDFGV